MWKILVQFPGVWRNDPARGKPVGVEIALADLGAHRGRADEVFLLFKKDDPSAKNAPALHAAIKKARGDERCRLLEAPGEPWTDPTRLAVVRPSLTALAERLCALTHHHHENRAFFVSAAAGAPAQWSALLDALAERGERAFLLQPQTDQTVRPLVALPAVAPEPATPRLRTVTEQLERLELLPAGSTVLLTGPTGAGKSALARELHARWTAHWKLRGGFYTVNCASLSPTLLESELFGYEKGAFTGASQRREGLFKQADGGTLFLDEFGEIPLDLQARLLTALEPPASAHGRRRIRRVGGHDEHEVDLRIVVGTNRDLFAALGRQQFREDLLGRIGTYQVRLPPLREARHRIPAAYLATLDAQAERFGLKRLVLERAAHLRLFRFALREESAWRWNYRDVVQSAERLAFEARCAARKKDQREVYVTLAMVEAEVALLSARWQSVPEESGRGPGPGEGGDEAEWAELRAALATGALEGMTLLQREEARWLLRACSESRTDAEAWVWLEARNVVRAQKRAGGSGRPQSPADSFLKRWQKFAWRVDFVRHA